MDALTEATGGDSETGNERLEIADEKFRDTCVRQAHELMDQFETWRDDKPVGSHARKWPQKKRRNEARELFDKVAAEAASQIATLTADDNMAFIPIWI